MKYNTYMHFAGEEIDVIVDYNYHRARRGARDTIQRPGDGPPLEPDEPERVEICGVVGAKGTKWEGQEFVPSDNDEFRITSEILGATE